MHSKCPNQTISRWFFIIRCLDFLVCFNFGSVPPDGDTTISTLPSLQIKKMDVKAATAVENKKCASCYLTYKTIWRLCNHVKKRRNKQTSYSRFLQLTIRKAMNQHVPYWNKHNILFFFNSSSIITAVENGKTLVISSHFVFRKKNRSHLAFTAKQAPHNYYLWLQM